MLCSRILFVQSGEKKCKKGLIGVSVIHNFLFPSLSLSLCVSFISFHDQFRVFPIRHPVDSAMISDSIPNASVALASSNPKDFAKKKRVSFLVLVFLDEFMHAL